MRVGLSPELLLVPPQGSLAACTFFPGGLEGPNPVQRSWWQRECGGGAMGCGREPQAGIGTRGGPPGLPRPPPAQNTTAQLFPLLAWCSTVSCATHPGHLTSESNDQRQKKGEASSGPPAEHTPGPVAPEPQVRPAQLGSPRQGRHRTGHAWLSEGLSPSHVYALLSWPTPAAVQITAHFHLPLRLLESPPSTVLTSQSPKE